MTYLTFICIMYMCNRTGGSYVDKLQDTTKTMVFNDDLHDDSELK